MSRLSEELHPVYIVKPADHAAGVDGVSVNMEGAPSIAFLIQFGAVTGNAKLSVYSGASDGTKTTQETFNYRLAQADHGSSDADVFASSWSTSSELTLTAATYDNKVLAVEIDARALTDGQNWVTLEFSSDASALNVAAVAVALDPRYASREAPSIVA